MLMEAILTQDFKTVCQRQPAPLTAGISDALEPEPGEPNEGVWKLRLNEARVARWASAFHRNEIAEPIDVKIKHLKSLVDLDELESFKHEIDYDALDMRDQYLRNRQIETEIRLLCTPAPSAEAFATKIAFLCSPEHGDEWGYESQNVRVALRADAVRFGAVSLDC